MTSAYIFIAAILLLGGVIAALGDHLGTKVGKARLRLFKFRPRQTATIVTILTGTLISASTLGVLLALSESLREGLFNLNGIRRDLRESREELVAVQSQKVEVEQALADAEAQEQKISKRLSTSNDRLEKTQSQLTDISGQANTLRQDIKNLSRERSQLRQQQLELERRSEDLQQQVTDRDRELQTQVQRLAQKNQELAQKQQELITKEAKLASLETQQQQLQAEIAQQDQAIAKFDAQIAQLDKQIDQKNQQLEVRQIRFDVLNSQLDFLRQEVTVLEQYYQDYQQLRGQEIALERGQVLAFAALQVEDQDKALPAIDQILSYANQTAIALLTDLNPQESDLRLVRISQEEVDKILEKLSDGQNYVVRIVTAGNYVRGEQDIRVFADVSPNEAVFEDGDQIASVNINTLEGDREDLQRRLDTLLAASQFRARRAGILGQIVVGDGRRVTLLDFIEQLNQADSLPEELQAIAVDKTYTSGPLRLKLVALRDGKVIFSS